MSGLKEFARNNMKKNSQNPLFRDVKRLNYDQLKNSFNNIREMQTVLDGKISRLEQISKGELTIDGESKAKRTRFEGDYLIRTADRIKFSRTMTPNPSKRPQNPEKIP
jgi:hypothetical protein